MIIFKYILRLVVKCQLNGGVIVDLVRIVDRFTTTYAIRAYHHQCCEFESSSRRSVLDTTLCDKVCRDLQPGRWFSPGTIVFSTNKTDRHDITEIFLKVTQSSDHDHTYWWLFQKRFYFWHILLLVKLKSSLPRFYGGHHDLVDRYGTSVTQITTDMFHLS